MKRKLTALILSGAMALALGLSGCGGNGGAAQSSAASQAGSMVESAASQAGSMMESAMSQAGSAASSEAKASESKTAEPKVSAEGPGSSGFLEIPIGEEQIVGPFQIATVYFQGVDMVPEGRQPSAAESDLHLEADIHMTPEAGKAFGFGDGEDIWPAYLTVNYKVMDESGVEVTSGSMMPMNADDGAHYGINVKKGVLNVGKYTLKIEIEPSDDYLLHVDSETGVPAARDGSKSDAEKYYEKQTAEFEWNYTAEQLQNK